MSLKARLKDNKAAAGVMHSTRACVCQGPDLGSLGFGGRGWWHKCMRESTRIPAHKDAKGPPWVTFLLGHPWYFFNTGSLAGLDLNKEAKSS